MDTNRKFAIETVASTGKLPRRCAATGFDHLGAADEPAIQATATSLRETGVQVEAVQEDLSTAEGVDRWWSAVGNRPVHALLADAGEDRGTPSWTRS